MRKVCSLVVLLSCCFLNSAVAVEVQLPVLSMMSEHYRNYDLRGEAYSDGSIHVWVTTAKGERIFDSRYPVQTPNGKFLQWKYDGQTVVTQSTPIPEGADPSLEGMFFASKDVLKMLGGGAKPPDGALVAAPNGERFRLAPMDDMGCDDLQAVSCTNKGICCDIHDDCYARNGCHALSWLGLGSWECIQCNIQVVACFADPNVFGPSECCFNNTCGQPRNTEGGGGEIADRDPLNRDPDLGGSGGSGGFMWAWTPYGSVGIGMGYYCAIIIGGQRVIVGCH